MPQSCTAARPDNERRVWKNPTRKQRAPKKCSPIRETNRDISTKMVHFHIHGRLATSRRTANQDGVMTPRACEGERK